MRWTKNQQEVIDVRNQNILVAAAAGSGKTAVLVERIISKLVNDHVDIDRLVVVTYTRAAAAEMKERIGLRLEKELMLHPEDEHLQRQMRLLPHAQVTTIDSFCSYLLKNYFHTIDMDPGFTMGDESDMKMLEQDILAELLEEEYQKARPEFLHFVETMVTGRREEALGEAILQLYHFSCSNPWPEEWLQSCNSFYEVEGEIHSLPWVQMAEKQARILLEDIKSYNEIGLKLCKGVGGPRQYAEALVDDSHIIMKLQKADITKWYKILNDISYTALSRKKNPDEVEEIKEQVKLFRKSFKDGVALLAKTYGCTTMEEEVEKMVQMKPICEEWVHLCRLFGERFAEAKEDKNVLDFNDLEHMALRILVTREKKDGEYINHPSLVADELAQYYDEILIDEYQDSNLIQETILESISGERYGRNNLFMVGDVKQSVYRFRLARPELFLARYKSYPDFDLAGSQNRRIDLSQNFRSRGIVLDSVNFIFNQIMKESMGGVEYDEKAALFEGSPYEPTKLNVADSVELLLMDKDKESEEEILIQEQEARMVARKIRTLINGDKPFYIWDKEREPAGYRPADYGDVVILLRTNKSWAEVFQKVLMSEGIPACSETSTGYFETYEIRTVLNLLRVLDNPRQDIPLAAVMRNAYGGMSDDDLAELTIRHPDRELYERVLAEARKYTKEDHDNLAVTCHEFLTWLNRLRDLVPFMSVNDLLLVLYEEKDYYRGVQAMPGGEQRVANLDMLRVKALEYENASYHGLARFVQYIEKIEKYEMDVGEANLSSQGRTQSVRIMSIHKSKGLEFPIVFAAGMGKKFNLMDVRKSTILHPDMGVGMDWLNPTLRLKKPMLMKRLMQERLLQEDLGEEMRVLYVALTRAREKLYICGAVNDLSDKMEKWQWISLNYFNLRKANTYLDWIMPAWLRGKESPIIMSEYDVEDEVMESMADAMIAENRKESLLEEIKERSARTFSTDLVQQMKKRMKYHYPYQMEGELPAKLAVSDLKKKAAAEEEEIHSIWASTESEPVPKFRQKEKAMNGADRGTIYHKVMEKLPFTVVDDRETAVEQIHQLVRDGNLTEEEFEVLNLNQMWEFLQSPLAKRMAAAEEAGKLKRETPFVIGIPARDLPDGCDSDELVLVQGIIDAFFEEEDGIILVDYKTDSLSSSDPQAAARLVNRYREQMHYYRVALERVYGKNVKEILLYSFSLSKEVLVC